MVLVVLPKAGDRGHDRAGDLFRAGVGRVDVEDAQTLLPDEPTGVPEVRALDVAGAVHAFVSAVRATTREPFRDHLGLRGDEDGQVRHGHALVEQPHEISVNAVHALEREGACDVPVADDDLAALQCGADLLAVLEPAGGGEARHRLTAVLLGAVAGKVAERRVNRLPRGEHGHALVPELLGHKAGRGRLADAARSLDDDE
jgi:hypothetical protein